MRAASVISVIGFMLFIWFEPSAPERSEITEAMPADTADTADTAQIQQIQRRYSRKPDVTGLIQLLQRLIQQRYINAAVTFCPHLKPQTPCVTAALQHQCYSTVTACYSNFDVAPELSPRYGGARASRSL